MLKAGLLGEHGPKWYAMRSQVQKDMMRPKSAHFYIGSMDEIAKEFVQLLSGLRDGNRDLPDDALTYLHRWALESIARIFLDVRIGALAPDAMEKGKFSEVMINQGNVFVKNFARMSIGLPLFKIWPRAFGWYRQGEYVFVKHFFNILHTLKRS